LVPACDQCSDKLPLLTKGNSQVGTPAANQWNQWKIILHTDVGNVERAMLANPAMQWRIYTRFRETNGYGAKMSPHHHGILVTEPQHHVVNPTNPSGALDDGVEHRLHVSR